MDLNSVYKVPSDFFELLELQKILDKIIETKNNLEGITSIRDIDNIKFDKIIKILYFKNSYGTHSQREELVNILFDIAAIINKDKEKHYEVIEYLNDMDIAEINIIYKNLSINTLILKLIHFLSDHRACLKDFIEVYVSILDRIDLNRFYAFKIYHNIFIKKIGELNA